jgi:hypothetical protein
MLGDKLLERFAMIQHYAASIFTGRYSERSRLLKKLDVMNAARAGGPVAVLPDVDLAVKHRRSDLQSRAGKPPRIESEVMLGANTVDVVESRESPYRHWFASQTTDGLPRKVFLRYRTIQRPKLSAVSLVAPVCR